MVESTSLKLIAHKCVLEVDVLGVKDAWADCGMSLACQTSEELLRVKSVPFYMSHAEFQRLVDFLLDQMRVDCDDRFPFVPTNLGFELSILDVDDVEATIQVLLNVGVFDGSRVYAGCRFQTIIEDLQRFRGDVADLARSKQFL